MRLLARTLVALLVVSGCSRSTTAPDAPTNADRGRILVDVVVAPSSALGRLRSAFAAEAVPVAGAGADSLSVWAVATPAGVTPSEIFTYYAYIVATNPSAGTVRVCLLGEQRTAGADHAAALSPEVPSLDAAHGAHGWAKLEAIAARLR